MKFVFSLVSSDQKSNFEDAVGRLEEIGCIKGVLLKCLFRLWRSKKIPALFPTRKKLKSLSASCRNTAACITSLEEIGLKWVLRGAISPPPSFEGEVLSAIRTSNRKKAHLEMAFGAQQDRLSDALAGLASSSEEMICTRIADLLAWYADLIEHWWAPRKDIVRSYGRVVCHLYPRVASGNYRELRPNQFELTTKLVDAFEDIRNPKGSNEKNVKNFESRFPRVYQDLLCALRIEHLNDPALACGEPWEGADPQREIDPGN